MDHRENTKGHCPCGRKCRIKNKNNGRESTVKWLSLPLFGIRSNSGFKKDEQTAAQMDLLQILPLTSQQQPVRYQMFYF